MGAQQQSIAWKLSMMKTEQEETETSNDSYLIRLQLIAPLNQKNKYIEKPCLFQKNILIRYFHIKTTDICNSTADVDNSAFPVSPRI